jgi:ribosomal protein L11 methyltransferase
VTDPPLLRYRIAVPEVRRAEAEAVLIEVCPTGFEETEAGFAVTAEADAPAPALPVWMEVRVESVAPGWRDGWRVFHRPCRIADTWIRPPWLDEPGDAVVLEPGYAFGTGSHPTTRGVGELLALRPAGSVLDLGCGSGLLSLLAARWGHRPVDAWDLDPQAVAAARANVERNGWSEVIRVRTGDALVDPLPSCDLVLANIERRVVEALLRRPDLPEHVIVSGIRSEDPLGLGGWVCEGERQEDGWRTLHLRRVSSGA